MFDSIFGGFKIDSRKINFDMFGCSLVVVDLILSLKLILQFEATI